MAISLSRPDPSSPQAVASATFTTTRRGFDQAEVRDLLRMVAAELARLQEREKHLERELRAAQRNSTNAAVALDEDVVTRLLGEETARILFTARDAASQIKIRAEEGAARMLREATDEAQRLREEAEVEAARRRQDASADAESELQMAKQQGREMVNEARAYRERVLSELARRRELARQQIEQLMHGRDRLMQAFERARLASVDVMAEMTPLGEPSEYVNLAPTTGPVPLMVPTREKESVDMPAGEPDGTDVDIVTGPTDDELTAIAAEHEVDSAPPDDTVVLLRDVHEVHEHDEDDDDRMPAPVVALFAGEVDAPSDTSAGDVAEASGDVAERPTVGDLFARLRAARADSVAELVRNDDEAALPAETAADESTIAETADVAETADIAETADVAEPEAPAAGPLAVNEDLTVFQATPAAPVVADEPDDSPFGRRDAALTPLIVASARRLKRVLADEQNDVLHTLRRRDAVQSLDAMLPAEADHARRYCEAIDHDLQLAALAGAASVDAGKKAAHLRDIKKHHALQPAADALTASIVVPLRERLARAVADAGGDNAELASLVRGIYREWKMQQIDEHLDDVARMAFGRGALAALVPGTPVCWIVDPNGPACPDAEDNSLGGVVPAGEPFPTAHLCAPAHEGCRCMLAPAPR